MNTVRLVQPRRCRPRPGRNSQRGAATLVVVMLLFFVISLTAAYTARNLIFEQRISANQYRSAQAAEAADAGLEWATAMLNGGRIGDDCLPTTDPTKGSFRQRYLLDAASTQPINPDSGYIGARLRPAVGTAPPEPQWLACQFDGSAWRCSCPTDALPALTPPTGPGPFPAFGVRFVDPFMSSSSATPPNNVVRVEVNGCTSFDIDCIKKLVPFAVLNCRTTACAMMAMNSGVRLMPVAALTARTVSGAGLTVSNPDPATGVTVHTSSASTAASFSHSGPAGSPSENSEAYGDAKLGSMQAESEECDQCMFSSVFGMRQREYFEHPSMVTLVCSTASPCDAAAVNASILLHPGRILHLKGAGGLTVSSAIGSAAEPVLLVVDGPLTLSGSTVTGFVYTSGSASLNAGAVRGALVSAGAATAPAGSTATITYDPVVLNTLRNTRGSLVRVPGSWRDYP